jgi:hypothetical protein
VRFHAAAAAADTRHVWAISLGKDKPVAVNRLVIPSLVD